MRTACPRVSLASTTASRSITPICGAARPTPGIASIVSIMSSQIARISSVIASTGAAGLRNRLSGHGRQRRTAMPLGPRLGLFALQFLHTARDHLALHRPQIIDEQLAVQMVDLMLHAGGPKPVKCLGLLVAVPVDPAHIHRLGALDLGIFLGDRQTPFLIDIHHVRRGDDLGIEHNQRARRLVLALDAIHHDQPVKHPDLRRCQSDARRVIHGFQHVVSQHAQVVRQIAKGRADFLETRVRMDQDRPFHAGGFRSCPPSAQWANDPPRHGNSRFLRKIFHTHLPKQYIFPYLITITEHNFISKDYLEYYPPEYHPYTLSPEHYSLPAS